MSLKCREIVNENFWLHAFLFSTAVSSVDNFLFSCGLSSGWNRRSSCSNTKNQFHGKNIRLFFVNYDVFTFNSVSLNLVVLNYLSSSSTISLLLLEKSPGPLRGNTHSLRVRSPQFQSECPTLWPRSRPIDFPLSFAIFSPMIAFYSIWMWDIFFTEFRSVSLIPATNWPVGGSSLESPSRSECLACVIPAPDMLWVSFHRRAFTFKKAGRATSSSWRDSHGPRRRGPRNVQQLRFNQSLTFDRRNLSLLYNHIHIFYFLEKYPRGEVENPWHFSK